MMTALIHLGYLGYDADKKSAYVPNYEVAAAFELALQTGAWSEVAKSISKCDDAKDIKRHTCVIEEIKVS